MTLTETIKAASLMMVVGFFLLPEPWGKALALLGLVVGVVGTIRAVFR